MSIKKNWIDSVVSYVSPEAGVRRLKARAIETAVNGHFGKRKYDAADSGRRTSGWFTPSTSANSEIQGSLSKIRDRARDLARNNSHAIAAHNAIVSNTIGTGILLQAIDKAKSRASKFQDAWRLWAETTDCDAEGMQNMYALQSLAMKCIVESGEVLVRKIFVKQERPNQIPLKIQILEPDFLDTSKDGYQVGKGNKVIQGIEFNEKGDRVAYWIWNQHPGDYNLIQNGRGLQSVRVDASQIKHIYKVDRPGQVRGVPWSHGVVINIQDLEEYEDASLVKQKVAAAFAAFVIDLNGQPENSDQQILSEKIEPGIIETLGAGKDIRFPSPPSVAEYDPFTKNFLRKIAKGYGITYESMTGDYSNVNFSSGRMGWIEFHRNIEAWRWKMFIPMFCEGIYDWFLEAAILAGVDSQKPAGSAWTPPRREMIDPGSEISAMVNSTRAGLVPLQENIRSLGYDPDDVYRMMKEDNDKLDANGLILDSDPRKTMKAGILQPTETAKVNAELRAKESKETNPDDDDPDEDARYYQNEKGDLYHKVGNKFEKVAG